MKNLIEVLKMHNDIYKYFFEKVYYLVCRKERFDVVVMQLQIFKEFIFKYLLRNGNLPRKIAPVNFFFFFFFMMLLMIGL